MTAQTVAQKMAKQGYITAREAANRTGKSIHTIYRWINTNEVDGCRVFGSWYVSLESLDSKAEQDDAKAFGLLADDPASQSG